jgi:outer membrane immunogenic protein
MKKLLSAIIVVVVLHGAPAYAGPPAPIYNWTGFYAGINAGGVWGTSDATANLDPIDFNPALAATGTAKLKASGFTGGGQLGYNWQFNNIVTGLEADFNYTGINASRSAPTPPFVTLTNQSFKSNWLATFRGRLGLAWDRSIFYVTGGLAAADINLSDSFTVPGSASVFGPYQQVRAGYTIGGGAEWAFSPVWSVKAEYLYVDLGTATSSVATAGLIPTDNFSHRITENIARLGLNHRF